MSDEQAVVNVEAITVERQHARDQFAMQMGVASTIFESGMFPDLKNAQQAFVKLLFAKQYKIPEITAMRRVRIIQGSVALDADLLKGLVKRTHTAQFEYDQSEGVCSLQATRTDTGEVFKCVWDRERACRAGLDKKDNWKKHEIEMLRHRCDAEACRALWPDVVGGLYMIEEMPDEVPEVVEEGTSTLNRVKLALGVPTPPSLPEGEGEGSEEGAGLDPKDVARRKAVELGARGMPDCTNKDVSDLLTAITPAGEVEIRLAELRRLMKAEPEAFKAVLAEAGIAAKDLAKQDLALLDDVLIAVRDHK